MTTTFKIVSRTNPKFIYAYGFTSRERAAVWLEHYRPANWKLREPVGDLQIIEDAP